jgi:hypothetical protein
VSTRLNAFIRQKVNDFVRFNAFAVAQPGGGVNGQLPISFEDLPIVIFISRFLPIEILVLQNCLFIFRLDSQCIFFFRLNHKQRHLKSLNRRVDFFDSDSDCNPEKIFPTLQLRNFFP